MKSFNTPGCIGLYSINPNNAVKSNLKLSLFCLLFVGFIFNPNIAFSQGKIYVKDLSGKPQKPRSFGKKIGVSKEMKEASLLSFVEEFEIASQTNASSMMTTLETLPAGTLIIAMDNALQGNAEDRVRKSYGLAVRLLHAGVPLKWIIDPNKTIRTAIDLSASARQRYPSIGSYAIRNFKTGPIAILPEFAAQAGQVITAFGNNIRVYELQNATPANIHSNLTHKPFVFVEEDQNPDIHTSILSAAGLTSGTHYTTGDLTSVHPNQCVTIITVPHNDDITTTQKNAVKGFVRNGGNFFAQCAAIRAFQGSDPRVFTNAGFRDEPGLGTFLYDNPKEPSAQFEGTINDEGGAVENFGFITDPPGGTRIVHDSQNDFKAYTGRIDGVTTSDGGYVHYLAGHNHDGDIDADRFYLNAVLRSAIRPNSCNLNIGLSITSVITNETCPGGNNGGIDLTVINGTAPFTYVWTGPNSFTATSQDITGLVSGTYSVTVTDANNLTTQASYTVTGGPCPNPCDLFNPTISGSQSICIENIAPLTLTASGGGTYFWSTGETTQSIVVTPSAPASSYSVTVNNGQGCVKTVTKTVKVVDCTGEICFNGNNNVSATANWVITYAVDPANEKVKIRATLSKNFVDNTYGTNAVGWPNGHTFNQLVGSDHLILSMLDRNNSKKMEVKLDYITASSAFPSGYGSLGVSGGDGDMILGNKSDVLKVNTSLAENFNAFGYVLTSNSPATNSNYAPNPTYPNWIYDVWYEVEVKLSVFGTVGFGKVGITGVHASPSKTGNNTETVTEGPCPDPCDIFKPEISGTNFVCEDNITPTELTVTNGVGTYLWSTGATTSSINVTPSSNASTYTVTVTSVDNCVQVLTKTIEVKPCSGQICFGGNNNVSATANWVVTYTTDPANNKVKIRATLSKNFVDNTYGTNAIGWPSGHTFNQLVGSDHLILSMLDGNNTKKMEVKMDYITATSAAPSGYKSLGVTGGDGSMILGSSSDVLSVVTSLDVNFNQFGYILTTNSPATNSNYAPNPTYPNWIYDVWYEIEVKLSVFGSAGFGKVGITGVHASPSKTGNNTETVTEGPCCELETRILGDTILCASESTTLTAIASKSLVLNATEDTEIWNTNDGLTKNYGNCDKIYLNGSPKQRGLYKFNISSLPANADIVSANLNLVKIGGNSDGNNISAHRITSNWSEGSGSCSGTTGVANFNQRMSGLNWSTPGGDFIGTSDDVTNVGGNGKYDWSVLNSVQSWYSGASSNFGLLLKFSDESLNKEMDFASSENSTSANRPSLTINYFDGTPNNSGAVTYKWSNGATTANINVSPSTTTSYTVTITESSGCTGTAQITVVVQPKPTVDIGPDITLCTGDEQVINSTITGIPSCGTSGITNCVTVISNSNGYIQDLNKAAICGDNAGAKLWTQGGNGTSYITLDMLSSLPAGTQICVRVKLEHCSSSSSSVSDMRIRTSNSSTTGFTDLVASKTFSHTSYQTYCYTLTSSSRYVRVQDNGKCSIRLDYLQYTTPDTYNNSVTYLWSGPGIIGSTTGTSITVNQNGTYTLVVTDCGGCTASDQVNVNIHNSVVAQVNDAQVCEGNSATLTANTVAGASYEWTEAGSTTIISTSQSINVSPSSTTAYIVTVRVNGCEDSDDALVIVNPKPTIDAGVDPEICIGQQVVLTANGSGGTAPYTYTWNNPSSTGSSKTVSPNTTTTYSVTVTDANQCSNTDNVTVFVSNPPIATAINNGPLTCIKTSVTLTASPATGVSYLWSNGATTGSTSVNNAGTYSVTVTSLASGCTATASTLVDGNTDIPAVNAGPDVTVNCINPSATLTAVANGSLLWSTGATSNSITVNPNVTTIYSVTVTASNGCTASDQVTVTANKVTPVANLTANGNNCITNNSQLFGSASSGMAPYTFSYSGPNGFTSTDQNPLITDNGTYTLTVTDVNGCTDTESIIIFTEFTPFVIVITSEICVGETVTLTASGGISYQWGQNANNQTTPAIQVSPTETTAYMVTVTSADGCVGTGTATITVYEIPVITSLDVVQNSSCNNTGNTGKITVNATGQSGLTLQYRINGGQWQPSNIFNNLGNGTYNVEVSYTTRFCPSNPVQATIMSVPGLVVVAEDDKIVCPSSPFTLTAVANNGTAPYNYNWSNGATGNPINITGINVNTTYIVTVTDFKGCTATDVVNVSLIAAPVSSISGPDQVCVDEFAVFTANPPVANATYFWDFNGGISADGDNDDPAETVKWPSIYQNTFRTVSLTITKDNCPVTYTKQVFVKQGPFLITSGSYDVCQGGSVQIGPNPNDPGQVSPGATFLWTPNLFLNNNAVAQPVSNPPFDITYTLTATINGCVETRQVVVNVEVNLNPIADAGPDKVLCDGESVVIGGNPTATPPPGGAIQGVVWIPAAGLNNPLLNNPTASPTSNTQYQVVVVATSGCADTAFVNITVNPRPTITASASPSTICINESSTLTAVGSGGTQPYTFSWSNGLGSGASKTVSPQSTTTYLVTISDINGCTASTSVTVTVNPRPTITASASPSTICINESSTLTAVGSGGTQPYTFSWSNGLGSGASKTVSPQSTTTYLVTISDINGCTASTSVTVTVNPRPTITASSSPSTICINESSTLTAVGSGGTQPYTFSWSNGLGSGASKTVSPQSTTTYLVTISDINGCTASTSVTVTVNPRPTITASASPSTICINESSTLTAVGSGGTQPYTFSWSNGLGSGASKTVSPQSTTTYLVTISDINGCTSSTIVTVTVEGKAKVGNFVWEDKNANGIQDNGEPGILGIPVRLYNALTNTLVDQTNTVANGLYEFNVCKGTYYIEFGDFQNYFRTFANVGLNVNVDSDANQTTGRTDNFVLNPGDNNQTIDAGYYRLATIGDFVWLDINANGIQDPLELGVPNIPVSITGILENNTLIPPQIQLTGPNGEYLFSNLIPGRYIVVVNKPVDYNFSPNDQGGDEAKDSDTDPLTGVMPEETLESGEINLTYDAGIYPKINIELNKTFVSATIQPNGTYNVTYTLSVSNIGGPGQYDLKDYPEFDNDVTINSASYSSSAPGNSGSNLFGFGPWVLADNQSIIANTTHNYTLILNVSLNLSDNNGDNIYTVCGSSNNNPKQGDGLYNRATVDTNNDGIPEDEDDACGDLPNVTMVKNFVSTAPNANGTYNVTYQILVNNNGGATGQYSLKDTPLFDDDVTINSGSYSGQASGPMNTTGSTTLANGASINAGATHTYNVTFNVSLDLSSTSGGDNVYTACSVQGNNGGSNPGQGLYNRAELDRTGDGSTDITDDACGDLPNVTMVKNFVGTAPNANGTYNVTYQILVNNNGGATGQYSLKDTPLFDDDVTINSGSYSGQASGPMNTTGSTTLASGASINAGATHTYNVTFNVSLDLSSTSGGDNVYTACSVQGNNGGSNPGQGLYNRAELDRTGDGSTDITDDACGDLPNVTMVKNFVSTAPNANGTYNVTYQILVNNNGGATGQYSLKDTPLFDDDVTINSGSYSGQASGPMNTTGSTTLANGASINAGATHTYNVTFNVSLDLSSTSGGDNVYTACSVQGNNSGSNPGQGLYNRAELDRTGDGVTDITDDACGDLPNVTMVKNFVGTAPNANGTYNVTYQILVNNNGGATGQYSLKDTPLFDDDVTINSGSYSGQASGPMNTTGSTTLASGASINAGATHTYNVTFNVSLDLSSTSGGDNVYTACSVQGNNGGSNPGQGLYNRAELDRTGDGVTDITDDACGDLPNVTMVKNFVSTAPNANGTYNVTYQILVNNNGGATGQYSLKDTPLFDDDVTINSGSYNGQASGPMNTTGSTTLASGASINAGATHTYNVTFNVSLDLSSTSGGDNVYTACSLQGNNGGSNPGQGLYNRAELDRTGDGVTDITDDACGDLPNVTMVKNFVSTAPNANGTYNVTYQILVNNNGGATGQYSLKDTPLFDDDVTINSGSYSGQASGPMNTTGSTTLASGASINAGATHTYNVTFNVTLDLAPGSPDGGDNIYTPCEVSGNGPGSNPGQGLYNRAELDRTGDGVTDITDDACGDLPNVTMVKNFVGTAPNANGTYNVTYQILVNNNGGATGQYSLKDTPLFDDDVTINSGSYSGQASGPMNTTGSTTLASGASINAGATHTYNVTFNVSLDLSSTSGGDNVYTACSVQGNNGGSNPGQGLYNRAELDRTGDGSTDITDDACGDLPNVTMVKNFVSTAPNANGTYNVTYQILVNNNGGATGQYSLKDTPLFDDDVTINSGSYNGQASGPMNTTGSTTLASGASINAGATHTYNVTFNVSLDLSSTSGGDNVYTACSVQGNNGGSNPGQGLYNRAELDRTGDGVTDITDDACGDLPNVTMVKNFVSTAPNANGTYNVTYQILVNNNGGATGQYSLKDTPLFDDDVTINSGSYSGQASGPMNTTGSTTLASGASINAGATHTYNVTFNVTLDLAPGSPDGGDNIYTPCEVSGNGPGSNPGQGLYNRAELDRTGDGVTDITDDACGDLPNVTMVKNFVGTAPNANGTYNVTYQILVNNNGGATGQYSLKDTPLFDDDVTINSGSYSGQASGPMNTTGSTTLASGASINAGATHTYNVTFNVSLDLSSTSGGDNVYTACSVQGNNGGSNPGQGLYNRAELDRTGDGSTDITDDACGDLPNVTMVKNFVSAAPNANGTYNVTYQILVNNNGGATGQYSLKDTPLFDDDVTINSGSYSGQASGPMNTTGSTTLANGASINAGATHTYNVTFNVSLDLSSTSGGDNVYTACSVQGNNGGSNPGQGLYNRAELDRTGDGSTDITDDACGDLPNVTMVKNFVSTAPNANGTYNVTYQILVNNNGGATGQYSLKDTPLFDDDVTINSGSYSGQASGPMNTTGSTTLANGASINAGATHTYNVTFNVSLDLSSTSGGDNVYTACSVQGNNGGSNPGQGLYNRAELDRTGDGVTDITDDACGDLPNVTMVKNFVSTAPNANGTYNVTYQILVNNNGGATGQYSLKDTPLFDDDVTINSGSYNGQASGPMNTTGSTTLASGASINAGATHTYNVTFNVSLDLSSTSGGDNVYTACSVQGNNGGSNPGQGLYNRAELDRTGDGVTDITDDACGDLPNVTMVKNFVSTAPNANGTYNVTYQILVNNNGGATGQYSLKDTPLFDDDVTINSGSYSGQASGPMNTTGSTTLANGASINAGATHTYNVTFNVSLDLSSTSGGDNVYTACSVQGNNGGSNPGQGLYNRAELDRTGDGSTDITDDACGDLPNVTMVKNFVSTAPNANGTYNVTYQILVNNNGGATGQYSLKDTPLFDDDVTINSGSYNGQASGPMNTTGSTTLASGASINAGATHTYNVTFNVSLDLSSTSGGDNVYTACSVQGNNGGSNPGQGLYNRAELDRTGDGVTDITDDACGDLPNVTMVKNFVSTAPNANGTYNVTYQILVNNNGGATGQYSLKDTPLFDDDVTINSGSYSGQASGPMNTTGSTTLASGASINAGATHTYNVTFNVSLDLSSTSGGDNVYTACSLQGNNGGSNPGQGLYNRAELDRTGDGVTDITDDACGDLPNVTMVKNFVSTAPNANGTYNVTYQILVNNNGGATGQYSLKDTPLFDDDVTINSGSYSGQASGPMNTTGSTTLANGASINAGATHTYNVTFNVSLDLSSTSGGDNVYTACSVQGNNGGSNPGQGLYNRAELDRTGDGSTDITDDACGDLPNVTMVKNFVGTAPNANGTYNVTYQILVNNNGGATGQYSLKDTPLFDDDVTINSGSYSGQASGPMNTTGSTTLANGASINAGATHTYNVTFNVSLDLSSTSGGDNVYTACSVQGNNSGSNPGQGLYNRAELDRTGDGVTDITDDACGDLPNVTMVKNFVSTAPNANGTYNVTYQILVNNNGGATGQYSLKDTPLFDDDVTINSGSYSGQASGPMNTTGSTTLANGASINAGATHTYNVTFNVSLDLSSTSGGDNVYTACSVQGNNSGSNPGQGLYNRAELDRTGDGVTDITDDACGDLPNVTMVKNFVSTAPNANGTYNVTYQILVNNNGGATGQYSLKDTPLFDDDVTINSGSYSGQASGPMNTTGSTTLANGASINAGATHTYNVTFNVSLDLSSTSGGDNVYTACSVQGNNGGSNPGQGLYNRAELDRTGDGSTDITDDACGDLPNVTMVKNFVSAAPNANGTYNVTYQILVNNNGGATGQYSLKDTPLFDDDVTINSGSYSGQASGPMNTTGSTTLANGASINAGATHTYNVTFNVSLDLSSTSGGDNVYTACSVQGNNGGSNPGQGLYNRAELDRTGDGSTDITDDACGDLPNVTMVKNFVGTAPNANGTYNVTYQILVNNNGGATGQYSLKDTPLFDDDVTINSGSYSGQASGPMNTTGSTTLANGASINAGATHTYNVTFNVSLDLSSTSGGDNVYTACSVQGNNSGSNPGQGLYNRAELDRTGDGSTDITDDACGDLPANLGDFVWLDLNGNGQQDNGEPGIEGVSVMLSDQNGNPVSDANGNIVMPTVTNSNGGYAFTNLNPGQYTVMFIKPNGYQATIANQGNDVSDSDANVTTGKTGIITLLAGQTDNTIDAGFYQLSRLGDFVWDDLNANGIQDSGEPGIPNVLVRLFNSSGIQIAFKVTDPTGYYEFINLNPGTYTVKFDKPMGYEATRKDALGSDLEDSDADPITGITAPIVLSSNESNITIDAGFYKLAKIGDFVWEDINANGIQDNLEPGIAGTRVNLSGTDALGNIVSLTTTTNTVGFYQFVDLVPGSYTVTFVRPGTSYKSSPANATGDVARDSDANPVTGVAPTEVLISGENNTTYDAGFYRCSNVGDYVWLDQGIISDIQDAGDLGLNGILVELYSTLTPLVPVQTMLTIPNPNDPTKNGYYNFEVCQIGTYFIKVRKGSLYDFVTPNQGLDDAIDSDIIDFDNESTLTFTVGYAVTIADIDAGLKSKVLPIQLKEFTGRWNQFRDINELTWITLSEINNDYFNLERSVNGSEFEVIAKVQGSGNSNKETVYIYDDKNIGSNGVYTYKLTQFDFDGRSTTALPVEIIILRKGEVKTSIWPNPSIRLVNVEIHASEGSEVKADLFDNNGRLIMKSFIDTVSDGKVVNGRIDGDILSKGVYYIMVNIDGQTLSSHKLLIIE
jgi:hypothetical protein